MAGRIVRDHQANLDLVIRNVALKMAAGAAGAIVQLPAVAAPKPAPVPILLLLAAARTAQAHLPNPVIHMPASEASI